MIRWLDNFLVPMQCTGNLGCFPRGKSTAIVRHYPPPPFFLLLCGVLVFPLNSDMDHRIFKHAYLIILMCAYTHGGCVHQHRVSTTFWLWKTHTTFSCAPDGVRTSSLWISSRCCTNWASRHSGCNLKPEVGHVFLRTTLISFQGFTFLYYWYSDIIHINI